jgi:hypothetical protein
MQTSAETRRALARIHEIAGVIEVLARCASEDSVEVVLCELTTLANEAHHLIIDNMARASLDIEDQGDAAPLACGRQQ